MATITGTEVINETDVKVYFTIGKDEHSQVFPGSMSPDDVLRSIVSKETLITKAQTLASDLAKVTEIDMVSRDLEKL